MKKTITALLLLIMFLSGCAALRMGTLQLTNNSSNPYSISIDGVSKGTMNGNTSKEFKLEEGSHSVSATQQSGYVLYPTVFSGSVNIQSGQKSVLSFP